MEPSILFKRVTLSAILAVGLALGYLYSWSDVADEICRNDEVAIKKRLLRGFNPNGPLWGGYTALTLTWDYEKCNLTINMAKLLIERGADVNQSANGVYPVHAAAFWHDRSMLEYLLGKGADPDVKTPDGKDILHLVRSNIGLRDFIIRAKSMRPDKN